METIKSVFNKQVDEFFFRQLSLEYVFVDSVNEPLYEEIRRTRRTLVDVHLDADATVDHMTLVCNDRLRTEKHIEPESCSDDSPLHRELTD